jgi:hypothetical protein
MTYNREYMFARDDCINNNYNKFKNTINSINNDLVWHNKCVSNICYHNLYKLLANPSDEYSEESNNFKTIDELKTKIKVRITKNDDNIYDITAPSKWLQKFENETGLKREDFKTFISSYELPNITSILEDIKTLGGIEYKGSQSFKIAKKRSSEQENYWEIILKEKYKDLLGTQFKYESCIFDFINISTNTIFECKLNLKDFNEEQYNKYLLTLDKYNIIYLIGTDCIINMDLETIYTTDLAKYILYQCNIPVMKNPSKFDELIFDFDIYEVHEITDGIF